MVRRELRLSHTHAQSLSADTHIHTHIIHTYIHTYTQHTYIHTYIQYIQHTYIHTYIHTYMHTTILQRYLVSVARAVEMLLERLASTERARAVSAAAPLICSVTKRNKGRRRCYHQKRTNRHDREIENEKPIRKK